MPRKEKAAAIRKAMGYPDEKMSKNDKKEVSEEEMEKLRLKKQRSGKVKRDGATYS